MTAKITKFNATTFRHSLFQALNLVLSSFPVIIQYKNSEIKLEKIDSRSPSPHDKGSKILGLTPLMGGKILKPLGPQSDAALRRYIKIT